MQKLIALSVLLLSVNTFAGLPEMMQIYHHPQLAPHIKACQGDVNCNAFTALATQWQSIPKNYRYQGFNIRKDAENGDAYSLHKGFSLQTDRSLELVGDYDFHQSAYTIYYGNGNKTKAQEKIFAQGLAVLLYIEDKNGWAK